MLTPPKNLENVLKSAIELMRGAFDLDDCKNYLFRLLLLKRLSDLEKQSKAVGRRIGDRDPAQNESGQNTLFVPEEARWKNLQRLSENIGAGLNKASAAVENANPKLKGILTSVDFNIEYRLGGSKHGSNALKQLIKELSSLNLGDNNLAKSACEYLIEKFASDAGKKGEEFHTPQEIVELLVRLLEPQEGMRICDPACGQGGILVECVREIDRKGGNSHSLSLYGQEIYLAAWAIAQINLLLHDISNFDVRYGDSIREPQLVQNDKLILFDQVITNPPLNLDRWGYEMARDDRYQRFHYGIPPKNLGDFAFIQHVLATLNSTGKAGMVVPLGVLFRGGVEGNIRKSIIEDDLIEAVIGLASNLFHDTTIPAAVLIFNQSKREDHQNRVLFIDASHEYQEGWSRNQLREGDIVHILETYQNFQNEDNYATVVTIEQLASNDYALNINRYVETTKNEEAIALDTLSSELHELEAERAEAENTMNNCLRTLELDV